MTRFTLCAVSIAMFVAASLPQAVQKPVTIFVEKTPTMWLSCSKQMEVERGRVCRARAKSERTKL